MILMNRRRAESGELWQVRFFDRAVRTMKEYNEKVEYIHLNPVSRAGRAAPGLAMVQRERIFRRECRRTRAALWVDD